MYGFTLSSYNVCNKALPIQSMRKYIPSIVPPDQIAADQSYFCLPSLFFTSLKLILPLHLTITIVNLLDIIIIRQPKPIKVKRDNKFILLSVIAYLFHEDQSTSMHFFYYSFWAHFEPFLQ